MRAVSSATESKTTAKTKTKKTVARQLGQQLSSWLVGFYCWPNIRDWSTGRGGTHWAGQMCGKPPARGSQQVASSK